MDFTRYLFDEDLTNLKQYVSTEILFKYYEEEHDNLLDLWHDFSMEIPDETTKTQWEDRYGNIEQDWETKRIDTFDFTYKTASDLYEDYLNVIVSESISDEILHTLFTGFIEKYPNVFDEWNELDILISKVNPLVQHVKYGGSLIREDYRKRYVQTYLEQYFTPEWLSVDWVKTVNEFFKDYKTIKYKNYLFFIENPKKQNYA